MRKEIFTRKEVNKDLNSKEEKGNSDYLYEVKEFLVGSSAAWETSEEEEENAADQEKIRIVQVRF